MDVYVIRKKVKCSPLKKIQALIMNLQTKKKLDFQITTSMVMILAGQQILRWQNEMVMTTNGIGWLIDHEFSLLLS